MISVSKQVILCTLVAIAMVLIIYWVLHLNIPDQDNFPSTQVEFVRLYELNVMVFFATLFSTSRSSIIFVTDKLLGKKIAPSTLGLINVLLKTVCIVLFDFRIIHVGNANRDTRMMILYADIASNFFNEACQAYPSSNNNRCRCCHNIANIDINKRKWDAS